MISQVAGSSIYARIDRGATSGRTIRCILRFGIAIGTEPRLPGALPVAFCTPGLGREIEIGRRIRPLGEMTKGVERVVELAGFISARKA